VSVIYYEWSLGENGHVLSIYGNVIWSSIHFTSNCTLTGAKLRPVWKIGDCSYTSFMSYFPY
jgi:hypothetical protein